MTRIEIQSSFINEKFKSFVKFRLFKGVMKSSLGINFFRVLADLFVYCDFSKEKQLKLS